MSEAAPPSVDIAIVGGGLAGGLTALALAAQRPDLRLALIEAGPQFGGNHLWSCFASDIAPEHRWLVAPLVCHAWDGHDVRFADHARRFAQGYQSIESERLDAVLRKALPPESWHLGTPVDLVTPTSVRLSDGRTIVAGGVIDARGPGDLSHLDLGWQKFMGQRLDLAAPHGLTRPVIMDATVDQADGYRFVYLLPLGPRSIFVEDTYYSTDPDLDTGLLETRIAAYAAGQGWTVAAVGRSETGVLPVAMGGDLEGYWRAGGEGVAKIGLRGGFFHAMTGYSLVDAVRTAVTIAALPDLGGPALHGALHGAAQAHWRGGRFYRLLARLLFRAADASERHRILSRFYRLDPALIDRFYTGRSTIYDKLRILAGKPPVPLGRAITVLGAQTR
ncbi:lycopene beta-cyclase CrtY [Sphingobium sufflavum]|uniref:lycopene beta-cyclase CrtY n=1 Tax=Sphingobium sufflavum TaxID=1129547 RepID=UPI001F2F1B8F|nr:lycopene beta-cyclase CrtY [Sphingobium sufflavum]MCE7794995.1 lycopene beta-cyclase CrtY [Sphingobium sufflavum]